MRCSWDFGSPSLAWGSVKEGVYGWFLGDGGWEVLDGR